MGVESWIVSTLPVWDGPRRSLKVPIAGSLSCAETCRRAAPSGGVTPTPSVADSPPRCFQYMRSWTVLLVIVTRTPDAVAVALADIVRLVRPPTAMMVVPGGMPMPEIDAPTCATTKLPPLGLVRVGDPLVVAPSGNE